LKKLFSKYYFIFYFLNTFEKYFVKVFSKYILKLFSIFKILLKTILPITGCWFFLEDKQIKCQGVLAWIGHFLYDCKGQ